MATELLREQARNILPLSVAEIKGAEENLIKLITEKLPTNGGFWYLLDEKGNKEELIYVTPTDPRQPPIKLQGETLPDEKDVENSRYRIIHIRKRNSSPADIVSISELRLSSPDNPQNYTQRAVRFGHQNEVTPMDLVDPAVWEYVPRVLFLDNNKTENDYRQMNSVDPTKNRLLAINALVIALEDKNAGLLTKFDDTGILDPNSSEGQRQAQLLYLKSNVNQQLFFDAILFELSQRPSESDKSAGSLFDQVSQLLCKLGLLRSSLSETDFTNLVWDLKRIIQTYPLTGSLLIYELAGKAKPKSLETENTKARIIKAITEATNFKRIEKLIEE